MLMSDWVSFCWAAQLLGIKNLARLKHSLVVVMEAQILPLRYATEQTDRNSFPAITVSSCF